MTKLSQSAVCGGALLGLSLVLLNYVSINIGIFSVEIYFIEIPISALLSLSLAISIVGGFMIGKAFYKEQALNVFVFGGSWVVTLFLTYTVISVYAGDYVLLSISSLLLAGIALFLYRMQMQDEKMDDLLLVVLAVSIAISIVSSIWESIV